MSYVIIYSLLIIVTVIWIFVKHLYTYWDRQGIVSVRPKLIYGNLRPTVKYQRTFPNNINDLYWEAVSVPYIGIYLLCRPALLIRDLKLIKRILTEDHDFFNTRGIYSSITDPMSINLFSSTDKYWPKLHSTVSQLFATQQTPNFFETIQHEGRRLINELEKYVNDVEPVINLQKIIHTHTLNVIGSLFFGLNINLFENLTHEFNKEICQSSWMSRFKQAQAFLYPNIMKLTKRQHFPKDAQTFLIELVDDAVRNRNVNTEGRNNILQCLVNMQMDQSDENSPQLSNTEIAAQLFSFYSAGTQTLSHTVASCLTELITNQDTLDKLLDDIDNTLKKHYGKVTYESLQEMSYLELCLKETLRKSPPTLIMSRECTKDYIIEETNQVIKTGTKIIIPVYSIHNDPKYFKNPKHFMPERFLVENTNYITPAAYLPFGDISSPRLCPSREMSSLIIKSAVVSILSLYKLEMINVEHSADEMLTKVLIKPRTEINNN